MGCIDKKELKISPMGIIVYFISPIFVFIIHKCFFSFKSSILHVSCKQKLLPFVNVISANVKHKFNNPFCTKRLTNTIDVSYLIQFL